MADTDKEIEICISATSQVECRVASLGYDIAGYDHGFMGKIINEPFARRPLSTRCDSYSVFHSLAVRRCGLADGFDHGSSIWKLILIPILSER